MVFQIKDDIFDYFAQTKSENRPVMTKGRENDPSLIFALQTSEKARPNPSSIPFATEISPMKNCNKSSVFDQGLGHRYAESV
jgi:geranylgeranyl pyrophosphate synthase